MSTIIISVTFALIILILLLYSWNELEIKNKILIVFILICVCLHMFNIKEDSEESRKAEIAAKQPFTKIVIVDKDCSIYYYYGNGKEKSQYTEKFVRCIDSSVKTDISYTCSSGKSSKTCTDEITTISKK